MLDDAPLLTIIIPTYNYGKFIDRQLQSLEKQINDEVEVIIVDDGSTDGTKNVVQPFLSNQIHYCWKPNGGVASARNYGIRKAKGTFLIFIDADDEFISGAIEQFLKAIKEQPQLKFFIGGYDSVWPDDVVTKSGPPQISKSRKQNLISYLLKNKLHIPNGAYTVHRDAVHQAFPEHLKVGEDTPLIAQLLSHNDPVVINDSLMRAYKHSGSLRTNISIATASTLNVVSEIFDTQRLAPEYRYLKKKYLSRRLLSLTRYHYKLGNRRECQKSYLAALKNHPRALFRLKYFFVYLKSIFKPSITQS